MKFFAHLAAAILAVTSVCSCSSRAPPFSSFPISSSSVSVKGNTEHTATVGTPFTVELRFNEGTGHSWEVQDLPEGVDVTKGDVIHAPHHLIGGSAKQVFVVTPSVAGDYDINFGLSRPWESVAVESAVLHLNVV